MARRTLAAIDIGDTEEVVSELFWQSSVFVTHLLCQCVSEGPKKESPVDVVNGASVKEPGDDLLSHGMHHTTIGAERFHFRVRDGIGWFPFAMAARQTGSTPRGTTDS